MVESVCDDSAAWPTHKQLTQKIRMFSSLASTSSNSSSSNSSSSSSSPAGTTVSRGYSKLQHHQNMSCSSATINEESPTTATPRSKFQNPRPVQQAIQSMTLNPSRLSRFAAESSNNKGESAAVAELKRSFTQNSIKRMAAAFTNKGRLSSMEQEESSSSSSSDEPSSSHHESTTTSPTSSSSSRDYESISSSSVDCSSLCQKQPSQLAQINKKIASSSSLLSNYSADSSRNTSSTSSNTNQMPFKIRSSKYRHVYGLPHKEEVCYKNLKITKNAAHDSAFCAVNPKFLAIVTEECGGGAFIVIPIRQTGRIDINLPKVTGHRGPVLDLKWNPFNDNEIASCSEDTTIKVWQISDHGLHENLNEWCVDLHGHQRKVGQIEWHPTAENVMISSSADLQVIIWNLEKAEPIRIISAHNDTIQSMCWNRDGSFFVTTCKDKKLRVFDPRTGKVISEGDGHQGSKISKVVVLGCGTRLFTTGFSRLSERQIALWNIKDLSKPIQMDVVDCSSGILIPYYDQDTNIVFVAGKGDGNIRYYEITEGEPYMHYLSEFKSSSPQRGLGWMPKRGLDVTKNEIFRFYKLHATGGMCEPISMIVPRKSEVFQEDIYPDTISGIPSLSCDEWISGVNKEPILMSLKDGAVPFMPKIVTYKQLGFSELRNSLSRPLKSVGGGTGSLVKPKDLHSTTTTTTTHFKIGGASEHDNGTQSQQPFVKQQQTLELIKSNNNSTQHYSWSPSSQSYSNDNDVIVNSAASSLIYDQKKLVLSSQSAFNKMSSSSSYSSSSPPSSPQSTSTRSTEYQRINPESMLKTFKIRQNIVSASFDKSGAEWSPDTADAVTDPDSTLTINNNNEANKDSLDSTKSNDYEPNNKDIEASYFNGVSKNLITLRKTESLKLDSAQSIRNRFDRINTNTLNTLSRNPNRNKSSFKEANSSSPSPLSSSSSSDTALKKEDLNSSTTPMTMSPLLITPSTTTTTISPRTQHAVDESDENDSSTSNHRSLPLHINTMIYNESTSTTHSGSQFTPTHNGERTLTNHPNTMFLSNGNSVIKKRVWTPVSNDSNIVSQDKLSHNSFGELQKSYFRLLEEKNSLKEQLHIQEKKNRRLEEELKVKDKRILSLENKLNIMMLDSGQTTETTDC